MKIANCEHEEVHFWPADEIEAAFNRANSAMGTDCELEAMRLFVRTMNYFYKHAARGVAQTWDDEYAEISSLAQKGLYAELGITDTGA